MTEPVKRYYIMESAVVPMLDKQMTYTPLVNYKTDVHVIPLVMDADYARLEQECERLSNELNNMRISWGLMQSEREAALKQVEWLRDLLADWSSHFTGPKLIGGPLSSLRERTEETLSAKP